MKKFILSLVFAGLATFSYSQEVITEVVVPTKKYSVETNRFGANWFISVNGGINLYNGVVTMDESLFKHLSPNMSVYFGKWHTPGLGWRVGYTGLNVKCFEDAEHYALADFHFDFLFNLTNLCCGYREDRIYNAIPFIGAGWAGRTYSGSGLTGTLTANYGLLNTFRVARRWAINLELTGYLFRNGFSGKAGESGHDMMWSASVGVTFRLGKPDWDPIVDVDALQAAYGAMIAELEDNLNSANAQNRHAQNEIAALKNDLNNMHKKYNKLAHTPHFMDVKQSTFFPFGSAQLDSKKEELNIKAYADAAKAAGVKLRVIGFADTTGADEYNMQLSKQRAETVAEMLRANGATVEAVLGQGESAEYSNKSLNRRAIIEVVE